MQQEAQRAAEEAARQRAEAEKASAAALAQQQAAQAAADQAAKDRAAAQAQQRAAEAETEKARQAAAEAEAEKAQLRAQLLNQLNSILQTRDSARGLIVNMSDVLFDTAATHSSLAPAKNLPKFPASFSLILASLSKSKATRTA